MGVSVFEQLSESTWNSPAAHLSIYVSSKWTCRKETLTGIETGLSMLAHANMPLMFWNEACSAVFLINRLPSQPLGDLSPYEKLFKTKPNYSFLRTFGCLCFPNIRPFTKTKLQFRSVPCVFLGYSPLYKGYKCRDPTGRIFITRHVTFNEAIFPYNTPSPKVSPSPNATSKIHPKLIVIHPSQVTHHSSSPTVSSTNTTSTSVSPIPISTMPPSQSMSPLLAQPSPSSLTLPSTSSPIQLQPSQSAPINSHSMITRSKVGIFKPKAYLSTTSSSSSDVPPDIHAAMVLEG